MIITTQDPTQSGGQWIKGEKMNIQQITQVANDCQWLGIKTCGELQKLFANYNCRTNAEKLTLLDKLSNQAMIDELNTCGVVLK